MNARFEAGLGGVERAARGGALELGRRRAGGAPLRRRSRARRCSARRTRSWRRRWPRSGPAREVEFVDCNREDLCMSFADFERAARAVQAAGRVPGPHRRPHRVRLRADRRVLQRARDLPDRGLRPRARARRWNGRKPGTYGDAGVYSMYATKTISTGEGGVLVSRRPELIEHARDFRNYGKPTYDVARPQLPDERVHGRARAGPDRAAARDRQLEERRRPRRARRRSYPSRLELPDGMISGLYKYIVFDWLERSTGRVYDEPCHRIMGHDGRPAEQRLGRAQPLLRAAVLPAEAPSR